MSLFFIWRKKLFNIKTETKDLKLEKTDFEDKLNNLQENVILDYEKLL